MDEGCCPDCGASLVAVHPSGVLQPLSCACESASAQMPPGVRFSPEATIDAVLAARERLVKTLGLRTDVVVEISLHPELVDLLAGDLVSEIEAELRDDR